MRVLLFVLLVLFPLEGGAGHITVVTEQWPPYNYVEQGEVKGLVTDIVKAVMKRTGLDYTIQVLPWARSYQMALSQENVLIYSIFRLPSREPLFKWIPVEGLAVNMHLFKPAHRTDIRVNDLEEVKNYRVGVTRDTSTHHFLLSKGFVEGRNLIALPSEKQNILMTLPDAKRTDFCTGDRLSLARWVHLSDLPPDYLEQILFLFHEDIYLAFGNTTSDQVVERVRRAVRDLASEGALESIIRDHREAFGIHDQ